MSRFLLFSFFDSSLLSSTHLKTLSGLDLSFVELPLVAYFL